MSAEYDCATPPTFSFQKTQNGDFEKLLGVHECTTNEQTPTEAPEASHSESEADIVVRIN